MKYIQTYIPGSHEKSNLCIDHMYLCAARFSRRLLNVFECCAILLNCRMLYIQRGSKFHQIPLWVLSLWNCATASRAPREDRPWRMGRPYLWRTFTGQLCLRICRCHGHTKHPSCEDQHPSCEDQTTWWQLKYSIFYMFNPMLGGKWFNLTD